MMGSSTIIPTPAYWTSFQGTSGQTERTQVNIAEMKINSLAMRLNM